MEVAVASAVLVFVRDSKGGQHLHPPKNIYKDREN